MSELSTQELRDLISDQIRVINQNAEWQAINVVADRIGMSIYELTEIWEADV